MGTPVCAHRDQTPQLAPECRYQKPGSTERQSGGGPWQAVSPTRTETQAQWEQRPIHITKQLLAELDPGQATRFLCCCECPAERQEKGKGAGSQEGRQKSWTYSGSGGSIQIARRVVWREGCTGFTCLAQCEMGARGGRPLLHGMPISRPRGPPPHGFEPAAPPQQGPKPSPRGACHLLDVFGALVVDEDDDGVDVHVV